MYVVPLPVVRAQKSLHITPHALYSVWVGACTLVNEASAVINGAVRVTFRVEIPVCSSAITDDLVPGSIHVSITAVIVSAVLSGTGTRNVLPVSRSTPPKTHCPLRGWPLWYLHRPNLLSCHDCIGTAAILFVYNVGRYAAHEVVFRYITSCKVSRLLCYNHESCLKDFVSEHMTAALLRHHHPKLSFGLGSAHQVISRPQVLHGTLLGSNPTFFKNWMPRLACSPHCHLQARHARQMFSARMVSLLGAAGRLRWPT
jgi:hypothetical protein